MCRNQPTCEAEAASAVPGTSHTPWQAIVLCWRETQPMGRCHMAMQHQLLPGVHQKTETSSAETLAAVHMSLPACSSTRQGWTAFLGLEQPASRLLATVTPPSCGGSAA